MVAGKTTHEREMKYIHWRITETPMRGVTSRDRSLGREQNKSGKETVEERIET